MKSSHHTIFKKAMVKSINLTNKQCLIPWQKHEPTETKPTNQNEPNDCIRNRKRAFETNLN